MYIDPGAGSMILQIAGAAVISGLVAVSRVRRAVRHLFRKLFVRDAQ